MKDGPSGLDHGSGVCTVFSVGDSDSGAIFGQSLREKLADATGAPGNYGDLSLEPTHKAPPFATRPIGLCRFRYAANREQSPI
jgi:hypothetical protein